MSTVSTPLREVPRPADAMTSAAPLKEWNLWTTLREIEFVDGLGGHAPAVTTDRIRLLELYRESIPSRRKWDGIDHEEVTRHVDALLAELRGKQPRRRAK